MPRRRPLKHREKTGARADVFSVLENSFARSAQKQVHQYFATRLPLLPVAFTAPHSGQLLVLSVHGGLSQDPLRIPNSSVLRSLI